MIMTTSHTLTVATTSAFLFLLSSPAAVDVVNADTIFESLFPTKCIKPLLQTAGFCVLNAGCTTTCFGQVDAGLPSTPHVDNTVAAALSLNTQALENFYIPVDAMECPDFEDPICPATTCCPECREELNELYRCLILESNYNYLDYQARTCALDCEAFGGFGNNDGDGADTDADADPPLPASSSDVMVGDDDVFSSLSNETDTSNSTDVDVEDVDEVEEVYKGYNDDVLTWHSDITTDTDIGSTSNSTTDNIEVDVDDLEVVVIFSTSSSVTMRDPVHGSTTNMLP